MLRFLREKGKSWVLKGVLGFVALTFVSWGGYSMTSRKTAVPGGRVAAWVDDIPISVREFESRYFQQAETMRQRFGSAFTPELEKSLGLRRMTLSQLVSEKLQIKEAGRLGIQVLDEEVALRIQEEPSFQRAGQFDAGLYRSVLRANRLNPRQFEDQQRLVLAIANLRRYIGMGATVSENEIRAAYQWLNEKVRVDSFRVTSDLFSKNVAAADPDLKAHYEKNKNRFRVGARRKAAWWYLPFKAISTGLSFKESDLRAHYEKTRSQYALKEEVTLHQILLKVSPDSKKEKMEQAEKKLAGIREQILKGKRFEEMAKQHSEGPSASDGGKLGTFKRKEMFPALEKIAFSLKVGEVSEPVRSQFGVHLLKVTKHQRPGVLPFDKAKPQVEKSLRESKTRQEAKRILRQARYDVEDKKPVPAIKGLRKGETPFFEKGFPPLAAPGRDVFAGLVFDLKNKGEFSKEKVSEEGVLFVRLLDMKEPAIPEMKEIKERVRASYVLEKGGEIAVQKSKGWLEEIQIGKKTFKKLAAELNVEITKPELFARGAIPVIFGRGADLSKKIFGLKKGEVTTVSSSNGVIFLRMAERPTLDMSRFKEEKKELRKTVLERKKATIFSRRMEQIQKGAKIRLESGFSL